MGPINLLFQSPITFFILIIPLLYSVIIHEVAHGWVAEKMGDPTARWLGRISLNPSRHLDPIGTLTLLLFGFGWAKPVPINFRNVGNYRKGLIWISAAGPLANVSLAFLSILLLKTGNFPPWQLMSTVLVTTARINIILASFNLIPIPPLDGSKILMGLVSSKIRNQIAQLEPYGMYIIVGLLFFGLLDPLIHLFERMILGILGMIL